MIRLAFELKDYENSGSVSRATLSWRTDLLNYGERAQRSQNALARRGGAQSSVGRCASDTEHDPAPTICVRIALCGLSRRETYILEHLWCQDSRMKFVGSDASARVPPNSRDSATPCSFRHRCHAQTHCSCAFKSNGSAQTQKQSLVRHALVSAKRRRHNTRVSVQCTELATTIFAVDDGDAVRRKPLVQDLFRECGLFEVGQTG